MMKYSTSDHYDAYVFDLDGTLYDEFDFVKQAYDAVSDVISRDNDINKNDIYECLCNSWLSYGSSRNNFQIAYEQITGLSMNDDMLKQCISAYRNTDFVLKLDEKTIDFLDDIAYYPKAIISDGNSQLQRKKYRSLGLDKWISEDNVFVSGDYGKQYYKPNPYMGELVKNKLQVDNIVYYGDRDVDEEFAKNVGFVFRRVKR